MIVTSLFCILFLVCTSSFIFSKPHGRLFLFTESIRELKQLVEDNSKQIRCQILNPDCVCFQWKKEGKRERLLLIYITLILNSQLSAVLFNNRLGYSHNSVTSSSSAANFLKVAPYLFFSSVLTSPLHRNKNWDHRTNKVHDSNQYLRWHYKVLSTIANISLAIRKNADVALWKQVIQLIKQVINVLWDVHV